MVGVKYTILSDIFYLVYLCCIFSFCFPVFTAYLGSTEFYNDLILSPLLAYYFYLFTQNFLWSLKG